MVEPSPDEEESFRVISPWLHHLPNAAPDPSGLVTENLTHVSQGRSLTQTAMKRCSECSFSMVVPQLKRMFGEYYQDCRLLTSARWLWPTTSCTWLHPLGSPNKSCTMSWSSAFCAIGPTTPDPIPAEECGNSG